MTKTTGRNLREGGKEGDGDGDGEKLLFVIMTSLVSLSLSHKDNHLQHKG